MATNKNQHFVPRCYFREFTVDGAGRSISLYNIDRDQFIHCAPVKNQCSGDYFYGKDKQLEKAIQSVECLYATTIKKVLTSGYKLSDDDRSALKIFWLLQYVRTEAASRRSVELSDSMMSIAQISDGKFRLQIGDAVQAAMRAFADSIHVVSDLKVCLIKNRSKTPFITSDDPAILTNRWRLQKTRSLGPSFGLHSAGNILLLPISSKVLFLAYDGDMHSVPHTDGWVDVSNAVDIDALNRHQYLNARANLYIRDTAHLEVIQGNFKNVISNRLPARHRINYAIPDKKVGEHTRYIVVDPKKARHHERALIHSESLHPDPDRWPRLLKWRSNPHAYSNGTGLGYVRRMIALEENRGAQFRKVSVLLG